jgi:uncharacterized protein YhdP
MTPILTVLLALLVLVLLGLLVILGMLLHAVDELRTEVACDELHNCELDVKIAALLDEWEQERAPFEE